MLPEVEVTLTFAKITEIVARLGVDISDLDICCVKLLKNDKKNMLYVKTTPILNSLCGTS